MPTTSIDRTEKGKQIQTIYHFSIPSPPILSADCLFQSLDKTRSFSFIPRINYKQTGH